MTVDQLTPFLSTDPARVRLHTPCTQDGFTWATDGAILIRCPMIPEVPPVEGYPNCLAAWENFDAGADFQPLPPLPPPIPESNRPCEECEGSGEVQCMACDHWGECRACKGRGSVREGETRWMRLGGIAWNIRLFHKVATLPNPRFAIVARKVCPHGSGFLPVGTIAFICDGGGEGIFLSRCQRRDVSADEWKPAEVLA
jgi:hypothetical protein